MFMKAARSPRTDRHPLVLVVSIAMLAGACSSDSTSKATPPTTADAATSVAASGLPDPIKAIMSKPRYKTPPGAFSRPI